MKKEVSPPKWVTRIIENYCDPYLLEGIRGDLLELFQENVELKGLARARLIYMIQSLGFLRLKFKKKNVKTSTLTAMLSNYLLITLRYIKKHKAYAIINLLGLTVGLTASIIMIQYVRFELSYDDFHNDKERIYRLASIDPDGGGGSAKISVPMGVALAEEGLGIEKMTRLTPFGNATFKHGENVLTEGWGRCVDDDFFDVFNLEVLQGDIKTALKEPGSIILTKALATKYFGENANSIGQNISITYQSQVDKLFTVTAVIEDVPSNSHFYFSFLAPVANYELSPLDDWVRIQAYTYLKILPKADHQLILNRATELVLERSEQTREQYDLENLRSRNVALYQLQPLESIYLYSNLFREIGPTGNITYVFIMMSLAFFIILIACINFINLSTARATTRMKEIGVRKVNGSTKKELVFQFLLESIVFAVFSIIIATGIIYLILPGFNAATGLSISLNLIENSPYLLAGAISIGILAGFYPAFYLSSLKVEAVLKNERIGTSRSRMRQVLVVFQYTLSIMLIIATSIIYRQVDFMKNKNLGFNDEQIVILNTNSQKIFGRYEAVMEEMKKHPNVQSVSFSGNLPGGGDWGMPMEVDGLSRENTPTIRLLEVDHNYLETFKFELVEGRNFSKEFPGDEELSYILNEEAVRQLGWTDNPIGKNVGLTTIGRPMGKVIGVVRDFHFRSLHQQIAPIAMFMKPEWSRTFSIKLGTGDFEEAQKYLEDKWSEFDEAAPFNLRFFDQSLDRLYRAEDRLQYIVQWFTIIALFIAIIGLSGLASFTLISRTREFGIRKVMGASVPQIIRIVSKDFLKLILVAFIISIPFSILLMDGWLENFAYRIEISGLSFILTLVLMLLITFVTIFYSVFKVATANPVESLRYE